MLKEDGNGESAETNHKYNIKSAEILAKNAENMAISEAALIYEQLISTFPTSVKYWKLYVEAYMAAKNDEATKQLFSRCLLSCLQIPLWLCYIRFIKRSNEKRGSEGLDETRKAFDFMLSYVGTDIESGSVWMEYITFLKSIPITSQQEESQRMTSIRKIYQKAIITPTHHIEQIWKDYESFENSVSHQLAKGLISEYQPKFNSAKAVYREKKKYVDEIDWNMFAVPPTGSYKEQQYMLWKKFLAFEKGNPQRIDSASSNKRMIFTYEKCLLYLYHYPDIWYDFAMWHAKNGSIDSAAKVFQRAIKALPDSESLRYAYAELEESRCAIQMAKTIYEGLLSCGTSATSLAHIQYIRFLRRTEGVESARKYFLDARKLPDCTYHVYVAYALMTFSLDKDSKVAHNVFESGLTRFMHEPRYILDYVDFLCRLNDDRNVRALFERALSSHPKSYEIWNRFAQFEQTYGDLASMLKVEQRKNEALSSSGEDTTLDCSLHDVVARYSFMDLCPSSCRELDHLAQQKWLACNINKQDEKSALLDVDVSLGNISVGLNSNATTSTTTICPNVSKMVVYDPRRMQGFEHPLHPGAVIPSRLDNILKVIPPVLSSFVSNLPPVEGLPLSDPELLMSLLLQCNVPTGLGGKPTPSAQQLSRIPIPSTSELSGSSRTHPQPNGSSHGAHRKGPPLRKRKEPEKKEEDDTATVQSRPLPADLFRIRQIQRSRGISSSQTGSVSGGGSAFSGEMSGSIG
ncbi:mRNA 3'-end-processing protein rna14 [Zostera marina]|uniref:mRNA 3'-end-processing protein rna14 n=1 Tax=Zostera marina TaxID=29655 RepID=A0A0K9P357_ZOSMR|nr:mRNA 3'-end-processing protein rna14 [Zostera marina]